MSEELSPKQLAFCQQYVVDYNATQAAARAGYSCKSAQEQSSRLLCNVMVQQEIARRERQIENKVLVSKKKIIREFSKLGFSDIADYLLIDEHGCVHAKAIDQLPPGASAAIKKVRERRVIKSTQGTKDKPDGDQILESTLEYELHDKINPLVQMGKELGMFREKHEINIDEKMMGVFLSILPEEYAKEFKKRLLEVVLGAQKK